MSRTRTITLTLGSIAAGAVLATGVTGLAMAADATPSPSSSATTPGATNGQAVPDALGDTHDGMRGGPSDAGHGGRGHDGGMRGGSGGDALHGETVVKAADGTISTIRMIRGSVTAVSATSISVKAEDGYTATFAVTADTEVHTGAPTRPADGTAKPTAPVAGSITDVTVGDVAMVAGPVSGSTATATEVHAMTAAEAAQLETDRAARDAARLADQDATGSTATPSATQVG